MPQSLALSSLMSHVSLRSPLSLHKGTVSDGAESRTDLWV